MNKRVYFVLGLLLLLLLGSGLPGCGGGKSTTITPPAPPSQPPQQTSNPLSLSINADKIAGPGPRIVNLYVQVAGGTPPYTYEWDFNSDGIIDSTQQFPSYVFDRSLVTRVTVKDSKSNTRAASISIIVDGTITPPLPNPLSIDFDMTPSSGIVPTQVSFEALVYGGVPPYKFFWDFNADGESDSFVQSPIYTYSQIGPPPDFAYHPILTVQDAAGNSKQTSKPVIVRPSGQALILSVSSNPPAGQVPLTVTFTSAISGGTPPYTYRWNFGDATILDFDNPLAIANPTHTYGAAGTYLVDVTIRDAEGRSATLSEGFVQPRVEVSPEQTLEVTIASDITSADIPFLVNLYSFPSRGMAPFTYKWIFEDVLRNPNGTYTVINNTLVVNPRQSDQPNPQVHLASVSGVTLVRVFLEVTDALGSKSIAPPIILTPAKGSLQNYDSTIGSTSPPVPRVNAAIGINNSCPTTILNPLAATARQTYGRIFLFGGEKLSAGGALQGVAGERYTLVDVGDSTWEFDPPEIAGAPDTNGVWDRLNSYARGDQTEGHEPGHDTAAGSFEQCAGIPRGNGRFGGTALSGPPPFIRTLRTSNFIPRGSAAAAFILEPIETNPTGGHPGDGGTRTHWKSPDKLAGGGNGNTVGNAEVPAVPVYYAIGGRDASGDALTTVQKYYPPRAGIGDMGVGPIPLPDYSNYYNAQIVNNTEDAWSNWYIHPDIDQCPSIGDLDVDGYDDWDDVDIQTRVPGGAGGQNAQGLQQLPVPIYGHAAVSLNIGSQTFPYGPVRYIFILGGKEDGRDGPVSREFRILDTLAEPQTQGGGQNPREPDFPLWSRLEDMPIERYYHSAFLVSAVDWFGILDPTQKTQIFVFGGFDRDNNPVSQVDVFTFDDPRQPVTGSWQTFSQDQIARGLLGGFPERVVDEYPDFNAHRVKDFGTDPILHILGGKTSAKPTGMITTHLQGSWLEAPLTVIPRYGGGYVQIPQRVLGDSPTFEYFVLGGNAGDYLTTYVEGFDIPINIAQ